MDTTGSPARTPRQHVGPLSRLSDGDGNDPDADARWPYDIEQYGHVIVGGAMADRNRMTRTAGWSVLDDEDTAASASAASRAARG